MPSHQDLPPDYLARIKRIRERFGLSQTELATRLGVRTSTVGRWEAGQARPTTAQWQVLLEAEEHGPYALRRMDPVVFTVAEATAQAAERDEPPALDFSADAELVRVVAEAERLTYGHMHNPAFAAELSLIEPLPHQRIAVYDRMLPQSRLRFLLADDPGAGKTIMSGLLIRELLSRRLVRRVLIVPPAGLVPNWKREMRVLFRLPFEIVAGSDARARNPFVGEDSDLLIVSVDTLAGDRMFARLQERSVEPYDIVFFDEAHKLSANRNADRTIERTDRYKLAEALAGVRMEDTRWNLDWSTHHLMLLTATPHMGRDYPYYALWRLLEPDVFGSIEAFNAFPNASRRRYFIRRTKEEMVRYDGSRIYPKRVADTLGCAMSADEKRLYDATTEYLATQYNRARILNRSAARLAMSVFQRRLTSSTWALKQSFNNRIGKLDRLIADIEAGKLSPSELEARQRRLSTDLPDPIDAATTDETDGEHDEELENRALGGVVAVSLTELVAEREQVVCLRNAAEQIDEDSKFEKLREVITDPRFRDEKILIFTEHKDTLEFLVRKLEAIGFAGRVAWIHGQMPYGENPDLKRLTERQDHVELFRLPPEKGGATYMVCTDAAAEGINLQFCWLMVNYDIPWNPARLEQRMGRIHRYGQKHDPVHIVNLVSDPHNTREGRVLKTLLEKLETIRKELGSDKVFDVIGRLLDGKTLAEYMEEVVLQGAEAVERDIDSKATKERVEQIGRDDEDRYPGDGEVARELSRIREELAFEELRRVLPGHVRRFVEKAAPVMNLGVLGDLDGIFSLKALKPGALDPLLRAIETYPAPERNRFTIAKPKLDDEAVFFHPGEAVFDRLRAWLMARHERDALAGGVFIDPYATAPYTFHVARVCVVRRADQSLRALAREELVEGRLVGIRRNESGSIESCPVEQLLILRSGQGVPAGARKLATSAARSLDRVHAFLESDVVAPLARQHRERLTATVAERQEYIRRGYDYQEADLAETRVKLKEKADAGKAEARTELAIVRRRQAELQTRRDAALATVRREPELLDVGEVEFIAHALVLPSLDAEDRKRHDAEIEAIAMRIAIAHEEVAGASVRDVHKAELARAAGLSDYPGFDLLSRRPDGQERSIEVKGRARIGEVELSENEWAKAATLRARYWLYVAFDCASGAPALHTIRDPFGRLLAYARISAVIPPHAILGQSETTVGYPRAADAPASLQKLFGLLDQWSEEADEETERTREEVERGLAADPLRFGVPDLSGWEE
jgi:superfamily II DNA or RNA helicase/transcriptional regulator with XRE-family HTH domain